MKMNSPFNVNFARAVSEFEAAAHHFHVKRILYKMIFRGKGLEFDCYRDFGPDEDAEMIDWKASMRAGGRLLAKQYIEERDLKIWFVIDVSNNMVFGSTKQLKCEYSAEIVAALAHLILVSGDNVGVILFNGDIVKIINPAKGMRHYESITDTLTAVSNYGGKCSMEKLIEFLMNYLSKSTNAVFILSDFLNLKKESFKFLSLLGSRFEVIAMMIRDPLDEKLPPINARVTLEDSQTGKQIVVDSELARKRYEKYSLQQKKEVERLLEQANIDVFSLSTEKNFVVPLVTFLNERLKQKRYIVPKI